ncbi:hypothetical protein PIB30_066278, partial [Stylosanthes scabra]|nr:hypothetical protein [Stylosanthes scabra]
VDKPIKYNAYFIMKYGFISEAEVAIDLQYQPFVAINPNKVLTTDPTEANVDGATKTIRAKQPIRRRSPKKLMSSTQQNIPNSSDATQQVPQQAPRSPVAGPSNKTLATTEPVAHKIWQFIQHQG